MKKPAKTPESGSSFELTIEKLVYGGEGLGHHEGVVVFVPFTLPGDRVRVRPVERKKGFIRAEVTQVLKPGPARREPFCALFGRCGGCQWQHVEYQTQVESKRRILEELFHHRFPETRKLPIGMTPSPKTAEYRSRTRVQLRTAGAQLTTGYFRHRSHTVEDVSHCPLLRPALNLALSVTRDAHRLGLQKSGTVEVELACAEDESWTSSATAGEVLYRRVGEFVYSSAASAFFQANDFMLAELIDAVLRLAHGGRSALDLFSGVGFFSLPLARRYQKVTAVESDRLAHQLCRRNVSEAGLTNVETVLADVTDWMNATRTVGAPAFDLVLLDPPRTGAGPKLMKHLSGWVPENIIYVSCDPQTLVRDLAALPQREYRIESIQGLDLFPQTYHFETIVGLKHR